MPTSYIDIQRRINIMNIEKEQSRKAYNNEYWTAEEIADIYNISYYKAIKNLKLAGGSLYANKCYRVLKVDYINKFGEPKN